MPAGTTKQFHASQVVYRRGDPAGVMYVVVRGKVLIYRGDDPREGARLVGQGESFGESGLISDEPRPESAVAAENTLLLCIDRSHLSQMVKEHPTLASRILHELERRAGASNSVTSSVSEKDGSVVRIQGFDAESKYLFLKILTCPSCETRFEVEVVRESRLAVEARYPDFRVRYRDIEPLWYRYSVCPACFFTLKRTEYEEDLSERAKDAIKADEPERKAKFGVFDFSLPRDHALALTSIRLAEHCYEVLKRPALDRATVALNMMWLFEDMGNKDDGNRALRRAADLYTEAYQNDAAKRDPKQDQRMAYLIGWLSHRLYRTNQAMSFISQAMRLERVGDKHVSELVRDLLPSIRKRKLSEKQELESAAEGQDR